MRAVRFEADGSVRVVDEPLLKPSPDEVLVQVLAAGVCRTDLHLLDEVKAGSRAPLVPGHEIAGKVTRRGGDVYRVNVGDPVAVHFEQPCGRCPMCRRKRANLCVKGTALGFSAPGGYAEYVAVRQDSVLTIPERMDMGLAAPLACSGATAHRVIVGLGGVDAGDTVVVIGAGGVGLSAVQIARAQQARVLAVDVRESARAAAKEVGAEAVSAPAETVSALRTLAGDSGADIVGDFVGTAASLELSRSLLGVGGRLVVVAPGAEEIRFTADDLVDGGKAYLGAHSSTMADFARSIALAEAGHLRPVVTRREPLAAAAGVLGDLRDGKIVGRAVLEPVRK